MRLGGSTTYNGIANDETSERIQLHEDGNSIHFMPSTPWPLSVVLRVTLVDVDVIAAGSDKNSILKTMSCFPRRR